MIFFNTFRGRLLLILAFLLIVTLSVQYYVNLKTQQDNNNRRAMQQQTLTAVIALGVTGITSPKEYLQDLISKPGQTYLDEQAYKNIRDIIIINEKWLITDNLNQNFKPVTESDGTETYRQLSELTDLPPLMEGKRLGEDLKHFPNRKLKEGKTTDDEAHAIPIETSEGRWYIMVILKNDRETAWQAAEPLIFTLGIFLVSTAVTFVLVWRFTRPITDLSNAARRVADGDLGVRVPVANNDEMGRLSERFNEMTSELEKSKALEEQLQQAEKSAVIGRLGSAIAHEIRNPLNYINLTLDHLRAKLAPEDETKRTTFNKLIAQVKDEVARINQQITDFLNYSRPTSVNLRPIDASQVVKDSLRIVEGQAEENNITISVVEHENVPQIMGDPEFLRSVFNNLFINAVQAMGNEGGHLNVKISPEENTNSVVFEISDTGSGIPSDSMPKIFEPYFSTKETGTGLGLAIVQKIVELHKGTIDVESKSYKGTIFTIRLPKRIGG